MNLFDMDAFVRFLKVGRVRDAKIGHRSTISRHAKIDGIGKTRASHEESKKRRVMAARSRRINRGGSKRK